MEEGGRARDEAHYCDSGRPEQLDQSMPGAWVMLRVTAASVFQPRSAAAGLHTQGMGWGPRTVGPATPQPGRPLKTLSF